MSERNNKLELLGSICQEVKQFILTKSIKYNTIFYSEFDGILSCREHSERA